MWQRQNSTLQWSPLLYVLLCAPMVCLLAEAVRHAYTDVRAVRTSRLQHELAQLRAEAFRHAGQLETAIGDHGRRNDWDKLQGETWLRSLWRSITLPPHNLYVAVVDPSGRIAMHTDSSVVGQQLDPAWYQESVPEAGFDVVHLQNGPLTSQAAAYDVRVPLFVDRQRIGELHQGLDAVWFDDSVAAAQRQELEKWAGILTFILIVDGVAIAAMVYLAWHRMDLVRVLRHGAREWGGRMGQIAAGLAHEIRNPLHALRINLHTLRRSFSGRVKLDQEDLMTTITQSDRAIDTLEGLMRDLVRFATPAGGEKAEVNIVGEVRATLNLMSEDMRRNQIEVRTSLPQETVTVSMDPARLRQVLVNLLTFAQNNAGPGGWVELDVKRNGRVAEIVVLDSGPALTEMDQARVFEPFQAPKETGSGLGLALVKSFAEEADGSATIVREQSGCRFRIVLPLYAAASKA